MGKDDLDLLDRKILARYQADTRVPAQKIGAAVGLSAAAVQRRLKRMREDGLIAEEVAALAPERLGYKVTCLVGVDLERERRSDIEAFKKRMAHFPRVQQCYYVTGDVDFMLVVLARDTQDYEAFTREAFLDDPNVTSFKTYVVLDRVKVGLTTPID
jgi:DNA-binding Lrp family transcriptional regulator